MDKSLQAMVIALKKIFHQLKPQYNAISFILLLGKTNQGKTSLLQQSSLTAYNLSIENGINLYYNRHGVILEIGELWLNRSEALLVHSLKQLNHCFANIKITGIMLCIDSGELLSIMPMQLIDYCQHHHKLLQRFASALNYKVDLAIILTKLDVLTGFCEFFQGEHQSELLQPLGFSLNNVSDKKGFLTHYRYQFDCLITSLGQQVIKKIHPVRSTLKRTAIREFPLQLASLCIPIQTILQNITNDCFHLHTIYFTSAEQGGISIDRLNQKMQTEYALTIQDKFSQSNNYQAYFIKKSILVFQGLTKRQYSALTLNYKLILGLTGLGLILILSHLFYQDIHIVNVLNGVKAELFTYENFSQQNNKLPALYHLSQAYTKLDQVPPSLLINNILPSFKNQLYADTLKQLHENFVPELLSNLENIISNPVQTQLARYQALKIYLMLGDGTHYDKTAIISWFNQYWKNLNDQVAQQNKQLLLELVINKQPVLNLNVQIISDIRNYLNALPADYLYYAFAKEEFTKQTKIIQIPAFISTSNYIPLYYTKVEFPRTLKILGSISKRFSQENWVLKRQDLANLNLQLQQAYCNDYSIWWHNFINHIQIRNYHTYNEAHQLIHTAKHTLTGLIKVIQNETAPIMLRKNDLFNHKIASQFTNMNLLTASTLNNLEQSLLELDQFLTTMSVVHNDDNTIFEFTKTRFAQDNASDSLSRLYNLANQLPIPVSNWAKQMADNIWYIFVNQSKQYLNQQWLKLVYNNYLKIIAHRYPFDLDSMDQELAITDFDDFFAPNGTLTHFINNYLRPFLDTNNPQWQPKQRDGYMLPISNDLINELIRANVISNMFFVADSAVSKINFVLQKIELDPVVANLQLTIGQKTLHDNQNSDSSMEFNWPQMNAKLVLNSIDGNHYEIEESGPWAFFKILQKVNVLVDNNDSANLQILFEINGNSGRYLLKTQNQVNPFSPGILTGFHLDKILV